MKYWIYLLLGCSSLFSGLQAQPIEVLLQEIYAEYEAVGGLSFIPNLKRVGDQISCVDNPAMKVERLSETHLRVESAELSELMGGFDKTTYRRVSYRGNNNAVLWVRVSYGWHRILPNGGKLGYKEEEAKGSELVHGYLVNIGLYVKTSNCKTNLENNEVCWMRRIEKVISPNFIENAKKALPLLEIEVNRHKALSFFLAKSNIDYASSAKTLAAIANINNETEFVEKLLLDASVNMHGAISFRFTEQGPSVATFQYLGDKLSFNVSNEVNSSLKLTYKNMLTMQDLLVLDGFIVDKDEKKQKVLELTLQFKLAEKSPKCGCSPDNYYEIEGTVLTLKTNKTQKVKGYLCSQRPQQYVAFGEANSCFMLSDINDEGLYLEGAVMLPDLFHVLWDDGVENNFIQLKQRLSNLRD